MILVPDPPIKPSQIPPTIIDSRGGGYNPPTILDFRGSISQVAGVRWFTGVPYSFL